MLSAVNWVVRLVTKSFVEQTVWRFVFYLIEFHKFETSMSKTFNEQCCNNYIKIIKINENERE